MYRVCCTEGREERTLILLATWAAPAATSCTAHYDMRCNENFRNLCRPLSRSWHGREGSKPCTDTDIVLQRTRKQMHARTDPYNMTSRRGLLIHTVAVDMSIWQLHATAVRRDKAAYGQSRRPQGTLRYCRGCRTHHLLCLARLNFSWQARHHRSPDCAAHSEIVPPHSQSCRSSRMIPHCTRPDSRRLGCTLCRQVIMIKLIAATACMQICTPGIAHVRQSTCEHVVTGRLHHRAADGQSQDVSA